MFFNNPSAKSPAGKNDNSNLRSFYHKFTSLLGRGPESCSQYSQEAMLSARETNSEGSYVTPVSSVGDLLAMSPRKVTADHGDHLNETSDLLTGTGFDSICDVTMHELPLDEMYIDANSLDYLVKCAESNRHHAVMDRGKESLFVKFDPLYANLQRSAACESSPDSAECDVGYDTGSSASVLTDSHTSPNNALSTTSIPSATLRDKPMQVVPPVVNDFQRSSVTHVRSTPVLTRSVSAILTPTQVATDRLISISGSSPPVAAPRSPRYHNRTIASTQVDRLQSLRIILHKQDQEITQLAHENQHLKSLLHDSDQNYVHRIEDLESKVGNLTSERDCLLEREHKLIQQVNDKIMSNKQMSIVMEEYEKTISSLIGEQQREKKQFQEIEEQLTAERDQTLNHLSSMESSFNDLLSKYEKCKSLLLEAKDREKVFEQKLVEYEAGMKKYETLYNNLKKVTNEALNKANETLENTNKNHNVEIMKLNAIVKKHEITVASLQESLAQKTRDNEELTRICDQLINDVH